MGNLAIIAIGGNALITDPAHQRVEDQYAAIVQTAAAIAEVMMAGYKVLITHGNGPQVGFILRRSEIANQQAGMHCVPLTSCVADSQGAIGYQIQQALSNCFARKGINRRVVSVVTQVKVDPLDPAFAAPSKPIGSFYSPSQMEKLRRNHPQWRFRREGQAGFRRVVSSPRPQAIVELSAIAALLEAGYCVVAGGGGGIPVIEGEDGILSGRDAVIDKDFASAMLAAQLNADVLMISTSVEAVFLNFGTAAEVPLQQLTMSEAARYTKEGHFAAGSMLPKVEAAMEFVAQGGAKAVITSSEHLLDALAGLRGTTLIR